MPKKLTVHEVRLKPPPIPKILAKYPSKSHYGKMYKIIEGKDKRVYCTCWNWRKKKTCSHLNDYKKRLVADVANKLDVANEGKRERSLDSVIDEIVKQIKDC